MALTTVPRRIWWMIIAVSLVVIACTSDSSSGFLTVLQRDIGVIYFPRQRLVNGEWVRMTAEIAGRLIEVNGCIRIKPDNEDTSYLVIWGPAYSVSIENDVIEIRNGAGQVVAHVGEDVYMGGGEGSSLASVPVNSVDERLQQELPPECPGPYWIAGDILAIIEATPSGTDYWDGGEFAGQPVYSLSQGISQTAHVAFVACASSGPMADRWIRSFVGDNLHLPLGSTQKQAIQAVDASGQELWSVAISVKKLTRDVYLVSCSGKRQ